MWNLTQTDNRNARRFGQIMDSVKFLCATETVNQLLSTRIYSALIYLVTGVLNYVERYRAGGAAEIPRRSAIVVE